MPGTEAPEIVTLVGAGVIAMCDRNTDEATAELIRDIEGIVFTFGDNAYPDGRKRDFAECHAPSWGTELHRTRPSLGNHDHEPDGAAPYFDYFGDAAGPKGFGLLQLRRRGLARDRTRLRLRRRRGRL